MNDYSDRRRFPRLELSEDAVALTEGGVRLGQVKQAGGGGFKIVADSPEALHMLSLGRRLRVLVYEPQTHNRHDFEVEVKYLSATVAGVEFVTSA